MSKLQNNFKTLLISLLLGQTKRKISVQWTINCLAKEKEKLNGN